MSLKERFGQRDLTYSKWHRPESIKRFLPDRYAYNLDFIDIDAVEYCHFCKEPLSLIEIAKDVGQSYKCTTISCNLANRAGLPAYLVFYTIKKGDIVEFRSRGVFPDYGEDQILTPKEYAEFLNGLRGDYHNSGKCREPDD